MARRTYQNAVSTSPNRAKMARLAKKLWLVIGGMFVVVILISLLVGGNEPSAGSESDAEIMSYAEEANEENTVTSTLTLEEARSLLSELVKIHPDLDHPRNVLHARNTCLNLQQGYTEEEAVRITARRFGNDGSRVFDDAQGAQILQAIRANGFCQEEGFVRP